MEELAATDEQEDDLAFYDQVGNIIGVDNEGAIYLMKAYKARVAPSGVATTDNDAKANEAVE